MIVVSVTAFYPEFENRLSDTILPESLDDTMLILSYVHQATPKLSNCLLEATKRQFPTPLPKLADEYMPFYHLASTLERLVREIHIERDQFPHFFFFIDSTSKRTGRCSSFCCKAGFALPAFTES